MTYEQVFKLRDLMTPGLARIGEVGGRVFAKLDQAQNQVADNTNRLAGSLRNALAGIGLATFGQQVIQTTGNFEKMEALLTNTLGSSSAAQMSMAMIQDFAASTPFQVDQLTASFVKLANRGFVPTRDQMRSLGDLAASTGKDFDQLVEAMLDAQTGEFERLKEFGITAKSQGDQVSFTFKGVTTTVQKTDKAIQRYLLSLGNANGVSGSMAAISGTMAGQVSNLQDRLTALQVTIGQYLRPAIMWTIGAMGTLIERAGGLVRWLSENAGAVKGLAVGLGIVVIGLKAASLWTQRWVIAQTLLNLVMNANPIGIVVTAIGALVGAIVWAWNTFEGFRAAIFGIWEALKQVFVNMRDAFVNTFGGLGQILEGVVKFDAKKIAAGIAQMMQPTGGLGAVAAAYVRGDAAGRASFRASSMTTGPGGPAEPVKDDDEDKDPTGGDLGVRDMSAGAKSARNVTLTIDRVVGIETLSTTNISQATGPLEDTILAVLMKALRDTQVIAG